MHRTIMRGIWIGVGTLAALGIAPIGCTVAGNVRGRVEAGREWDSGRGTIYVFGLRSVT